MSEEIGINADEQAIEDGNRALELLFARRRHIIRHLGIGGLGADEMTELALVQQSIEIVAGAIDEEVDLLKGLTEPE